jgi:hypothetical protein
MERSTFDLEVLYSRNEFRAPGAVETRRSQDAASTWSANGGIFKACLN